MSNSFAIVAVTATLWHLFTKNGIKVSLDSPDAESSSDARINIFLYQVVPNLGYKNIDVPTRDYSGELITKQQVGLDLSYLITSYGTSTDELSSQRLVADVVRIMHENPILTPDVIRAAMADIDVQTIFPEFAQVDLPNQRDLVKFTMINLSLEDITKIWSSFFKTKPYRLSVAYKATVVVLDDAMQQPRSTMPVRKPKVYVNLSRKPEITYVIPQMVAWISGTGGAPGAWQEIRIIGKNLKADDVRIDFGDPAQQLDTLPKPNTLTDNEIKYTVPNNVPAGIKQIRVLHPINMGEPPQLHKGADSNMVLFALTPKIMDPVSITGNTLTVRFEPSVGANQKAEIIVGTYRPLETTILNPNTVSGILPSNITPGTYPVRLRIDGAESQPDENIWNNEYKRPTVTIP